VENSVKDLRQHLNYFLSGKGAHVDFQTTIQDFPQDLIGTKHPDLPYTAWQILEHMRIAQWDILEFSRNAGHISPEWPKGYWPDTEAPPNQAAWDHSVQDFQKHLTEMQELVANDETDLIAKIPHGSGQTILREALLVADHNAYHLGQLVMLRKLFGAW
jgi:hypothetical protein